MRMPDPKVPPRLRVPLGPLLDTGVLNAADIAIVQALTDRDTTSDVIVAIVMTCVVRRLGHSCLDLAQTEDRLQSALATMTTNEDANTTSGPTTVTFPDVARWIAALTADNLVEVTTDERPDFDRPLVLDPQTGRLWLARYAFYEDDLARRLANHTTPHAQTNAHTDPGSVSAALDALLAEAGSADAPALAPGQRDAVIGALSRPLTFLVGGPGTGKTWTIAWIVKTARALGYDDIVLAAPTGKAAERMTRSVGTDETGTTTLAATTIHRLLGLHPGAIPAPGERQIPQRLVIIDEASMIDLPMMARLVAAVGDDAHLVFVGDPDQLASVDVGSVLSDVVAAARTPGNALQGSISHLTEVFRQEGDSAILRLARAIRGDDAHTTAGADLGTIASLFAIDLDKDVPAGQNATDKAEPRPAAGLQFVDRSASARAKGPADVFTTVVDAAHRMIDAAASSVEDPDALAAAFAAAHDVKVLAANRRGPHSVADWSRRIRHELGFREGEWRVGRPVMVTRNDPGNGLSNGDTGIAVPDPQGSGALHVAFDQGDGSFRFLPPSSLGAFQDWWAMTIHKSQGSEYAHVVVSLPEATSPLLTRELIYTAVTRAKRDLTIIGTPDVLIKAIETPTRRASGLVDRLSRSIP